MEIWVYEHLGFFFFFLNNGIAENIFLNGFNIFNSIIGNTLFYSVFVTRYI